MRRLPLAYIKDKMRELIILFGILFLTGESLNAQCDKDLMMYKHYSIEKENDPIKYHSYSKNDTLQKNILIYIQGSGPDPLFKIKRDGRSFWMSGIPFDLETIPKEYTFFIVSKSGLPFCTKYGEPFEVPQKYFDNETLEYRTNQINEVIEDITTRLITEPNKIVIIGHSEGSDVVAKLGTINNKVTHIGFWSGSGNSQFYDFPLFVRKDVNSGKITEDEALIQMDSLFTQYREIIMNKDSTKKVWLDNSYKRWYYFSEPAIDNLIKIDIPIYIAMGAKDKSVPVESTYLIPTEFIRKGKDNLTFKVYPYLDHNFDKKLENGEIKRHWNDVFLEFMEWVNRKE